MTPCEFEELSDRHREAFEAKYVLPVVQFAQFASLWTNSHIPEGEKKTTPDDFIPKRQSAKPPPADPVKTSLYLMSLWDAYAVNQKP